MSNKSMKESGDKALILHRNVRDMSNCELLAELLSGSLASGVDSNDMAQRILSHYDSCLSTIADEDVNRMRNVESLGLKGARRIAVAVEWGIRCAEAQSYDDIFIYESSDVVNLFRPFFERVRHEEIWVLYISSTGKIIERQLVSQGGVRTTEMDHRLVVKRALELLCTHILMVHNHPDGNENPSDKDRVSTRRLLEAAQLFDIELMDHVIITPKSYFSFFSAGYIRRYNR